ncbi:MAG: hypothetical protein ACE5HD_12065 [Acidobacteriota bacterium]
MNPTGNIWAICPVEGCTYSLEYDPDEMLFCPTCEMEMIFRCPACREPIRQEEQVHCQACSASLKE